MNVERTIRLLNELGESSNGYEYTRGISERAITYLFDKVHDFKRIPIEFLKTLGLEHDEVNKRFVLKVSTNCNDLYNSRINDALVVCRDYFRGYFPMSTLCDLLNPIHINDKGIVSEYLIEYYTRNFRGLIALNKSEYDSHRILVKKGQKLSKFINEFLNHRFKHYSSSEGLDDYINNQVMEGYRKSARKAISDLLSALNEYETQNTFYISYNPYDFFRMSLGNSWRSCHSIDRGEYQGGLTGLIQDEITLVMYTESSSEYKLTSRRLITFNRVEDNSQVELHKVYGNSNFKGVLTTLQSLIEKHYKIIESGKRESWTDAHYSYCGYHDANYSDIKFIEFDSGIFEQYTFGSESICINCGDEHTSEESLMCSSCDGREVECYDCGRTIDIDEDYYLVDDDGWYYCEHCISTCAECGDTHIHDHMYSTNDGMVCERCFENYYSACDSCEEYTHIDDLHYHEDKETGYEYYNCTSCS